MTGRRKRPPEQIVSGAWKSFYHSHEGKAAIAVLFKDFGFFGTPAGDSDAVAWRSIGQRDVLVRISQLINMKPEQAPADDEDHSNLLDRMLR